MSQIFGIGTITPEDPSYNKIPKYQRICIPNTGWGEDQKGGVVFANWNEKGGIPAKRWYCAEKGGIVLKRVVFKLEPHRDDSMS